MSALGWGIVGTGRFGRIHAEVVRQLPGVELRALCNRTPEKLAQAAADFGVAATYQDYRRMLDDPRVDVVGIVTHWRDHFEVARDALAAGKHVVLEKPMAATARQCRELAALAEESAGLLLVGHICRFDPRYVLARQAVTEGRIGRIVSMHARRNLPTAPGHVRLDKISPLMGDGIHDADLMMWLLGRAPDRVYARQVRVHGFQYPDLGWAMLEFGQQAVGVVETVWCLPPETPFAIDARLEIIGEQGAIYVDCAQAGLAIHGSGVNFPDTAYWPSVHGSRRGALWIELEHFARCVRQGQPSDIITPGEAARAVAVIEQCERSAALGQPVELAWNE